MTDSKNNAQYDDIIFTKSLKKNRGIIIKSNNLPQHKTTTFIILFTPSSGHPHPCHTPAPPAPYTKEEKTHYKYFPFPFLFYLISKVKIFFLTVSFFQP